MLGWLRRFVLGLGLLGMDMVMVTVMGRAKSNGRSRFTFIIGFLGRVIVGGRGGNEDSFVHLFLYVMCTISIS